MIYLKTDYKHSCNYSMFIIVFVLITVFVLWYADPRNVNKLYYSYKNDYFTPLSIKVEVSMATISVPPTHTKNDDCRTNTIT
jgi:hypothetical protein